MRLLESAFRFSTLRYVLLAALLLVTAAYQARHTLYVVDYLAGRREAVEYPFKVSYSSPEILEVGKQAEQAGIQAGDRLLSINGAAYRGYADLVRAMEFVRPGDGIRVSVQRGAESSQTESTRILLESKPRAAIEQWPSIIATCLLLPLFCVLLGFWVAAVRARDPLAWLLLALLLAFSQFFVVGNENRDGAFWSQWALTYHTVADLSWSIWLLLLAVYFPQQWRLDLYFPWIKWLLIVPLALVHGLLAVILINLIPNYSFRNSSLSGLYSQFGDLSALLRLLAVLFFFVVIAQKYFTEPSPDAKRRLQLLYVGTFLALTPTGILMVTSFLKGIDLIYFSDWVLILAYVMTLLFPLTLAYLIMIHKAMDVSMVIRQGVQYAMARGGVTVLQGALMLALVISISLAVGKGGLRVWQIAALISLGIVLILQLRRLTQPLATWVDRSFFRENYNAEQLLTELGENVRTLVEIGPLAETVARRLSQTLHVPRIAVLLRGSGSLQPAYALGYGKAADWSFPEGGTTRRLEQSQAPALVYWDDSRSWVYTTPGMSETERQQLLRMHIELLLPLMIKDRLLGVITLSQKRSEAAYSKADLRLLNSVALQTALAVDNAQLTAAIADEVAQRERLNRELEIAREVQEHLFPQQLPAVAGLDYVGACRPVSGVGGDYYDFIELPGGLLGIAIGDVSGKGISAALMMSHLQAALRSQILVGTEDVSGIVARINRLTYKASSVERYATFFLAEYDPGSRTLSYVNAGHNPPLLFRARKPEPERLDKGGTVIGLMDDVQYEQGEIQLEPGDLLVSYTDGITDAINTADEEWGEPALINTIGKLRNLGAKEILDGIMKDADAFAAGATQHDDMTLVVLHLLAEH